MSKNKNDELSDEKRKYRTLATEQRVQKRQNVFEHATSV
jgi:hypothetical protein